MFGRPQAPQKEWGNMYFYEKLHHLIDHTSDFVISKVNWWLPSVATGMALSLFLLGGPEALPQAASIVLPSVTPAITTPPFAMAEGQHGGGGATEDEEEF
ncbi:Archaic translocase of outer membrane 11 kDa subunit [Novymonas esmeraldas]|uniref:Archaic translocase of outer membrane 11 kDa subunit n=1 Tax=Novymonas esmeraldas TaxID=1808958 RepID=A0AAW0EZC1_9TRYP